VYNEASKEAKACAGISAVRLRLRTFPGSLEASCDLSDLDILHGRCVVVRYGLARCPMMSLFFVRRSERVRRRVDDRRTLRFLRHVLQTRQTIERSVN